MWAKNEEFGTVTIFSIISNKKKKETPLDYVHNKFMSELSFSLFIVD